MPFTNRVATVILYLNDVPKGGKTTFLAYPPEWSKERGYTDFPTLETHLKVMPEQGMAVVFFPGYLPHATSEQPWVSRGGQDLSMLHRAEAVVLQPPQNTYTRTPTHSPPTHARTHARTHTHAHTYSLSLSLCLFLCSQYSSRNRQCFQKEGAEKYVAQQWVLSGPCDSAHFVRIGEMPEEGCSAAIL
jgi:hypothetical protein